MNGFVKALRDIDAIAIPAELLRVQADEAELEQEIARLSLRCAKPLPAAQAAPGDSVRCTSAAYADGRTILLYPGVALPGAEEANAAVIGKTAGETLAVTLCGKPVTLTVQEVLHREPVEVNDALIASLGLENVATVADYRAHLRRKKLDDLRMERGKRITRYLLDEMIAGSEFSYDEAEMREHIDKTVQEYAAYAAESGKDESPEELRDAIVMQEKQNWVAEAFCKEKGIALDEAEIEASADQMLEMYALMGEPVPERAEALEMARQDAAMTALFTYIDGIIAKKTEACNGND